MHPGHLFPLLLMQFSPFILQTPFQNSSHPLQLDPDLKSSPCLCSPPFFLPFIWSLCPEVLLLQPLFLSDSFCSSLCMDFLPRAGTGSCSPFGSQNLPRSLIYRGLTSLWMLSWRLPAVCCKWLHLKFLVQKIIMPQSQDLHVSLLAFGRCRKGTQLGRN